MADSLLVDAPFPREFDGEESQHSEVVKNVMDTNEQNLEEETSSDINTELVSEPLISEPAGLVIPLAYFTAKGHETDFQPQYFAFDNATTAASLSPLPLSSFTQSLPIASTSPERGPTSQTNSMPLSPPKSLSSSTPGTSFPASHSITPLLLSGAPSCNAEFPTEMINAAEDVGGIEEVDSMAMHIGNVTDGDEVLEGDYTSNDEENMGESFGEGDDILQGEVSDDATSGTHHIDEKTVDSTSASEELLETEGVTSEDEEAVVGSSKGADMIVDEDVTGSGNEEFERVTESAEGVEDAERDSVSDSGESIPEVKQGHNSRVRAGSWTEQLRAEREQSMGLSSPDSLGTNGDGLVDRDDPAGPQVGTFDERTESRDQGEDDAATLSGGIFAPSRASPESQDLDFGKKTKRHFI